jgi:hypothetical protein
LILCFNKKLVDNLIQIFSESEYKESIKINSLFTFLININFDFEKCNINKETTFEERYKIFETDVALEEFSLKFEN